MINKRIYSFVLILCLAFSLIFTGITTSAADSTYSDVLDDLRKDDTFLLENYPSVSDDYSLSVINIAESLDKELFIYVYQPSNNTVDIKAKMISIYDEYSPDGSCPNPIDYDLELVSTYDVFDKYLVKDYVVSDEGYRYYNLITLRVEYNEIAHKDEIIEGGTVDMVGLDIGQQWCAYWFNDSLVYEMNVFDTIEVDITTCGHIDIENGFNILGTTYMKDTYLNYVCFNLY